MDALTNHSKVLFKQDNLLVLQTFAYDSLLPLAMNQPQKDSFGSFNLGLHVNDKPNKVLINRCKLMDMMNTFVKNDTSNQRFTIQQIHWLSQVHGNQVLQVNQKTPLCLEPCSADAITTTQSGVALAIMTADCVPVILHQESTGKIAAIHAGWKGLANGIIAKTVAEFADNRGEISAWIGACIGVKNYEVSQDVLHQLVNQSMQHFNFGITYAQLINKISKPHNNKDKAWLDIQLLARLQLQSLQCVVHNQHIDCSYDGLQYYSYRRKTHLNQPNTGRMAMLIVKN